MPTLQQNLAILFVLSSCSNVVSARDQPATEPARNPALEQNFEMTSAISEGDLAKVKKFLDDGASINAEDESPLAASAFYGKIEIAKLLLARGADPDSASNFLGGSSLYIAAHKRDAPMVKLLLDRGARADLNGALLAAANAPRCTGQCSKVAYNPVVCSASTAPVERYRQTFGRDQGGVGPTSSRGIQDRRSRSWMTDRFLGHAGP